MEDVLELYAAPADPARPVVCVDEYPLALSEAKYCPQPRQPGRPQREDYEYIRRGSCSLFAAFAPHAGWRTVQARARRTSQDFAWFIRSLVDEHFPEAPTLRVVLDNLSTHTPAALYDTFPAAEARRIAARLEFHFTPAHGSWLNMIEIEWSILARQCLGRRLPDIAAAQAQLDAWTDQRNQARATVDWRFTASDAREHMPALYPNPSRSQDLP